MKPSDIETTRFPTALRGYDRDAVDGFLERLAFLLRYAGAHYGIDWEDDGFVEALAASGVDRGDDVEDLDVEDLDVDEVTVDEHAAEALAPLLAEADADRLARELLDAIHRVDADVSSDVALSRRSAMHQVENTD